MVRVEAAVSCRLNGWWRYAAMWPLIIAFSCSSSADGPSLNLPPRPTGAPGAAAIALETRDLDLAGREERVYAEIARGNVPAWLRRLRRVELEGEIRGELHRITFWVTPDYVTVGSDDDYLVMPLSARTAQRIADLTATSLPTPLMVDAIWRAAETRFEPVRIQPDEFMGTMLYFERHNNLVNAQRMLYDAPPGEFIAGHKVDVVITADLAEHPGEVALYGWHRTSGEPIQHLYIGATDSLVAFSHGIRLVDRTVLVDDVERDLLDVWRDPGLASILSSRGVIGQGRYEEKDAGR